MSYLLDSHTFLWTAMKPSNLSRKAKSIIADSVNDIWISTISFWEISLKYKLGKLELNGVAPEYLPELAEEMGLSILELGAMDSSSYHLLPIEAHKDPFDRMLVWQAIRNGLTLVSKDREMVDYSKPGLKLLW
ncbi:MAG: type II toxin-antitoxin system VapC family toxin [Planctomycetota bacterium]|nr:type II toxin-antitoxin system VapC family toxin [Planctomycetota bacterium]